MKLRLIIGGMLTSMWLLGLLSWAVQYRLQVVSLDALTASARVENSGPQDLGRSA